MKTTSLRVRTNVHAGPSTTPAGTPIGGDGPTMPVNDIPPSGSTSGASHGNPVTSTTLIRLV